ncbi:hypothetical protein ERJ75_000724500 [Trypanosoma vivax]|nr:hypothetical protein ERJ75_000724500 [Trypanosoma vivax]
MCRQYSICVAADCNGKKVNLRFLFDAYGPSVGDLLRRSTVAFNNYFKRFCISKQFVTNIAVVFNDNSGTWDRLEKSTQLLHNSQVYLFQPDTFDLPAIIPEAYEGQQLLEDNFEKVLCFASPPTTPPLDSYMVPMRERHKLALSSNKHVQTHGSHSGSTLSSYTNGQSDGIWQSQQYRQYNVKCNETENNQRHRLRFSATGYTSATDGTVTNDCISTVLAENNTYETTVPIYGTSYNTARDQENYRSSAQTKNRATIKRIMSPCPIATDRSGPERFRTTSSYSKATDYGPSERFRTTSSYAKAADYGPSERFRTTSSYAKAADYGASERFRTTSSYAKAADYGASERFRTTSSYAKAADYGASERFRTTSSYAKAADYGASERFGASCRYLLC